MKRKLLFITLCIGILATVANAQPLYEIGESFTYSIKWLGITVGHMSATVTGEEMINEREVYVIELSGSTNAFASLIYRIRDSFVSYVDKETLVPLKLEVSRREGFYKKDAVTIFDHEKKKAYFHNYLDKSSKEYDLPDDVYDIVSVFYSLRRKNIQLGDECIFNVAFAETVFTVSGHAQEEHTFKLNKDKRIKAYYTEPIAHVGSKQVTDGRVSALFSATNNHVPLRFELKAPLFTKITATLQSGEPTYS